MDKKMTVYFSETSNITETETAAINIQPLSLCFPALKHIRIYHDLVLCVHFRELHSMLMLRYWPCTAMAGLTALSLCPQPLFAPLVTGTGLPPFTLIFLSDMPLVGAGLLSPLVKGAGSPPPPLLSWQHERTQAIERVWQTIFDIQGPSLELLGANYHMLFTNSSATGIFPSKVKFDTIAFSLAADTPLWLGRILWLISQRPVPSQNACREIKLIPG